MKMTYKRSLIRIGVFGVGNQARFTFSNSTGINTCQSEIFDCTASHSFYFLFITDELFKMIAN